jgi:hypothetical protein
VLTDGKSKIQKSLATAPEGLSGWGKFVECVYCTEPKATCRQCKNQPNAYNMYTDLEGMSACLYLHVSFYSGVVYFCRYVFSMGK